MRMDPRVYAAENGIVGACFTCEGPRFSSPWSCRRSPGARTIACFGKSSFASFLGRSDGANEQSLEREDSRPEPICEARKGEESRGDGGTEGPAARAIGASEDYRRPMSKRTMTTIRMMPTTPIPPWPNP